MPPRDFRTTNWSLVRQAGSADTGRARDALNTLCEAYWYPVYAFIRSRNYSDADAKDLTQMFFERLLRLNSLANADPQRGRLRNYLLSAVKNFLISQHERAESQKRGGGTLVTSREGGWASDGFAKEPVDDMTPDRIFQQRWALTVLESAFDLLREEYTAEGKLEQYALLRPMLGFSGRCEGNYSEVSARSGIPVNTLKVHVHRLRRRWKESLRQQVALTLADPTEENIKDELRELLRSA